MPSPREEKIRESFREGIARSLCEHTIRVNRRWDTKPEELQANMAAAVDYAWRDFLPQADACLTYLRTRGVKVDDE